MQTLPAASAKGGLRPTSTVSKNPDDVFLVSKMHGFVAVPEGKEKGSRVVMQRMERLISRKKVATAIWTLQKGSDDFFQSKWSGAYMSIASEPAGLNVGVGRNGELENEVWRLNNKGTSEKLQGPTHILHEEALDKKVLETFERPVRQGIDQQRMRRSVGRLPRGKRLAVSHE